MLWNYFPVCTGVPHSPPPHVWHGLSRESCWQPWVSAVLPLPALTAFGMELQPWIRVAWPCRASPAAFVKSPFWFVLCSLLQSPHLGWDTHLRDRGWGTICMTSTISHSEWLPQTCPPPKSPWSFMWMERSWDCPADGLEPWSEQSLGSR